MSNHCRTRVTQIKTVTEIANYVNKQLKTDYDVTGS